MERLKHILLWVSLAVLSNASFSQNRVNIEYFFDKDPGVYKGIFDSVRSISGYFETELSIPDTGLSNGLHFLYLRLQDSNGLWSHWQQQLVVIEDVPDSTITRLEFSVDTGLTRARSPHIMALSPPLDSFGRIAEIKIDSLLPTGKHVLRSWAFQKYPLNSVWHKRDFNVIECPMLDEAGITKNGRMCIGDTLVFHEDIVHLGKWPVDSFTFSWKLNGTAVSSVDSFILPVQSDTAHLQFSFVHKHEARCKGTISFSYQFFREKLDSQLIRICDNDSARIHGKIQSKRGMYRLDTLAMSGCDSTSVVELIVNPTYRDTLFRSVCAGDSIRIHGRFIGVAGLYLRQDSTALGCDSLSWISLQINPVFSFSDSISICPGDTLFKHGRIYNAPGSYSDSFTTAFGCDSVFQTHLSIHPTYNDSTTVRICSGDEAMIHGKSTGVQGRYTFKGLSVSGCDSIHTVDLIVNPVYNDTLRFYICSGDSLLIHGVFEQAKGFYNLKGKTTLGCDSFSTVSLDLFEVYSNTDTFEICSGDSVDVHGKMEKVAGQYHSAFKTSEGCDSTFSSTLIVHPVFSNKLVVGLCGGDSFLFTDTFRTVSGMYTGRFRSAANCDSIVELNLTIDTVIRTDVFPEICFGDSVEIGGVFRKTAGTYLDTYIADKGCDSIVSRHLSIVRPDTTHLTGSFCRGQKFKFEFAQLDKPGTYFSRRKNAKGCDSILVLHLSLLERDTTLFSDTLCAGDSIFSGLRFKKVMGKFIDTLTNQNGCDSIVIHDLFVRPVVSTKNQFLSLCEGDSVFSGSSFKKERGNYFDTLTNRFGCDSIVETFIGTLKPRSSFGFSDTICFGDTFDFFGDLLTKPGEYQHSLTNAQGCDSVITLELIRRAQFIPEVISIAFDALGTGASYKTYQWFRNRIMLSGETKSVLFISQSGTYDVSVSDFNDCRANSWDELSSVKDFVPNGIIIYPNPSRGKFFLSGSAGNMDISIYSSDGSQILSKFDLVNGSFIDMHAQADGLYLIKIIADRSTYITRLVLVK